MAMAKGTLTRMFQTSVHKYGPKAALKYKRDGAWHTITYDGYGRYVEDLARGLMSLGIQAGDRVAIWSENRPEWSIADFGSLHAGAVTAPIYPTLLLDQCEYIVQDSGSKVLFVQDAAKLEDAVGALSRIPSLTHVVCMDPVPEAYRGKAEVLGFEDLYALGRTHAQEHPDAYTQQWKAIEPDALATLIYTSGTTGTPKGVMLTHDNLYSNVVACIEAFTMTAEDTHISFLPLSHSFERLVGHFEMVHAGVTVAFAEGVDQLLDNMQEVRPTVLLSVPRLYEKMYAGVHAKVKAAPEKKQKIFNWAKQVGLEVAALDERGKRPGPLLGAKHRVAEKLVFSKLRQNLTGGRTRIMASGAAALNPDVERFFNAVGLRILQGYGLTEASPVITCNTLDAYRYGSIGKPIRGVTVKLAGDGEILATGPNIMQGYYNLDKETTETLTDDGWLRTGDIGRMDEDGFYYITDRKKELFKTAYGKYIAPQPIEGALKGDPLVGIPVVLGAERKFAAVLIVPNWEALEPWAAAKGIPTGDRTALVQNPEVRAAYKAIVDKVNEGLPQYEKLKNFDLIDRELTIENDELTPTLKVKRRVLNEHFKDQIEALFPE